MLIALCASCRCSPAAYPKNRWHGRLCADCYERHVRQITKELNDKAEKRKCTGFFTPHGWVDE